MSIASTKFALGKPSNLKGAMTDDEINEACERAEREIQKILVALRAAVGPLAAVVDPNNFSVAIILRSER